MPFVYTDYLPKTYKQAFFIRLNHFFERLLHTTKKQKYSFLGKVL